MRSRSSPCSPVISASAITSAVTPTATPSIEIRRDERDERLLAPREQVAPGDVEFEGHRDGSQASGSRLQAVRPGLGCSDAGDVAQDMDGVGTWLEICTKLEVFHLADQLAVHVFIERREPSHRPNEICARNCGGPPCLFPQTSLKDRARRSRG